jgi:PAS domain S-box-containing protein
VLELSVYLLPLIPVLYLWLWQDPGRVFEDHGFHILAIALATLEGAGIGYVCWLCYQRSGTVLVKRLTQGFMAFTVVYSLHGMFTPFASHHMALFILYGPVSRIAMGVLLLLAMRAYQQPSDAPALRVQLGGWWRFLVFLMLLNGAVAVLASTDLGAQPWVRMAMESGAVLCHLQSLLVCRGTARTPLMRAFKLAPAWFAASSIGFMLSTPWSHLWWLAHGIFAVGFSILGYGVLKSYLTTQALEQVFGSDELFDDLSRVSARLADLQQVHTQLQQGLEDKALELDRSRHSFATFLEAVPDAVLIVEVGGKILTCNAVAEQLFGYAAGELLGAQVEQLTPAHLRESHMKQRQRFEFAPRTRAMGSNHVPLPCLCRDGAEFQAYVSIGGLIFEGRQCVVTLIRPLQAGLADPAQQRDADALLMERGRLMDSMLQLVPEMLFELRRDADGAFAAGLRSPACQDGLQVRSDAEGADWVRQWFNQVVPVDLPQLLSSVELAALQGSALQLQWRQYLAGHGVRAFSLQAGAPHRLAQGALSWLCHVKKVG